MIFVSTADRVRRRTKALLFHNLNAVLVLPVGARITLPSRMPMWVFVFYLKINERRRGHSSRWWSTRHQSAHHHQTNGKASILSCVRVYNIVCPPRPCVVSLVPPPVGHDLHHSRSVSQGKTQGKGPSKKDPQLCNSCGDTLLWPGVCNLHGEWMVHCSFRNDHIGDSRIHLVGQGDVRGESSLIGFG